MHVFVLRRSLLHFEQLIRHYHNNPQCRSMCKENTYWRVRRAQWYQFRIECISIFLIPSLSWRTNRADESFDVLKFTALECNFDHFCLQQGCCKEKRLGTKNGFEDVWLTAVDPHKDWFYLCANKSLRSISSFGVWSWFSRYFFLGPLAGDQKKITIAQYHVHIIFVRTSCKG